MDKQLLEPLGNEWRVDKVLKDSRFTVGITTIAVRQIESDEPKFALAVEISVNGESDKFIIKDTGPHHPEYSIHTENITSRLESLWTCREADSIWFPMNKALREIAKQLVAEAVVFANEQDTYKSNRRGESRKEVLKSFRTGKNIFIKESTRRFEKSLRERLNYKGKKPSVYSFPDLPELYEELHERVCHIQEDIKHERNFPDPKRRAVWKETIKSRYPDFPEDLLEQCNEEASSPVERDNYDGTSKPSDVALEWAARRSCLQGYERYSLTVRKLQDVLRAEKQKRRSD